MIRGGEKEMRLALGHAGSTDKDAALGAAIAVFRAD